MVTVVIMVVRMEKWGRVWDRFWRIRERYWWIRSRGWGKGGTKDILFFVFNVYFRETERERERARMSGGGTEKDRGQRIWSRLHTDSREPHEGLNPTNCEITTWRLTDWGTQLPQESKIFFRLSARAAGWVVVVTCMKIERNRFWVLNGVKSKSSVLDMT